MAADRTARQDAAEALSQALLFDLPHGVSAQLAADALDAIPVDVLAAYLRERGGLEPASPTLAASLNGGALPGGPGASTPGPHVGHELEQVGDCVHCVPCDERLYQGELPSGPETLAAIDALTQAVRARMRAAAVAALLARVDQLRGDVEQLWAIDRDDPTTGHIRCLIGTDDLPEVDRGR